MPDWDEDQDRLARWIRSLPKPCGLMACNDPRGQQVLDACWRVDVAVPESVAGEVIVANLDYQLRP